MMNRVIRFAGVIGALTALVFVLFSPNSDPAAAATFTAVATGDQHTCALTSANAVQCWGRNAEGEIGDGTTTDRPRS